MKNSSLMVSSKIETVNASVSCFLRDRQLMNSFLSVNLPYSENSSAIRDLHALCEGGIRKQFFAEDLADCHNHNGGRRLLFRQ